MSSLLPSTRSEWSCTVGMILYYPWETTKSRLAVRAKGGGDDLGHGLWLLFLRLNSQIIRPEHFLSKDTLKDSWKVASASKPPGSLYFLRFVFSTWHVSICEKILWKRTLAPSLISLWQREKYPELFEGIKKLAQLIRNAWLVIGHFTHRSRGSKYLLHLEWRKPLKSRVDMGSMIPKRQPSRLSFC